jgi:hypothetical protein
VRGQFVQKKSSILKLSELHSEDCRFIEPADWLSEGLNTGEQVNVKHNSGLHTPIVLSPVQEHDNLDGHPWADSITFADIAEAFNVDNLFDLERII